MAWGLPPNAPPPGCPDSGGSGLALVALVVAFVLLFSGAWFLGVLLAGGVLWWLIWDDDCTDDDEGWPG